VTISNRPLPAFRVETEFSGLRTTSWVTDTGEVVREESPLGLLTVRETPERARSMAVVRSTRTDLLQGAAVVPAMRARARIDDQRDVRRWRVGLCGAELSWGDDLRGAGQSLDGDVVEVVDPQTLEPGPIDRDASRFLAPEPFIESDDPDIVAEATRAVEGV